MLQWTSLLFATNAVAAFRKRLLFYAGLLVLLTVTSTLWHSSPKLEQSSMTAFWMDQVAIVSVILFSMLYASRLSSSQPYIWILLALVGIAAAISYYLTAMCSWDRSYPEAHGALHGIASLCGHCILAGI